MPKMKSHSGTTRRFRVTGSGKIMRRKANLGHLLAKKTSKRKRSLAGDVQVSSADLGSIRRLLRR